MKHGTHVKAELILVLVTILAGFGWIFSKEALAGFPPLFFMGVRFIVAGFVLFLAGQKYFRGLDWQSVKQASLVGLVMGVTMMFWVTGLDQGSNLGVGAFITSLGVVLVPVVARFMFGARPPMSIWVALPIAVVGLGFLALNNGLNFEFAHLYFLGAAFGSAFQLNLLARFSMRMHALVLTAIQLSVAGCFLLLLSLLTETLPHSVSMAAAGWFLLSTLVATSLRFLLQTYGMSLTPVSHAAVIMNLEPVWTAIFAVFWFSESMASGQMIGCLLIFIAMLVSRWPQIRTIFKPVKSF
ncbi:DMT family transporter [Marinomonas rhizomae]|uniref:EamA domain-containing membrane protein RarD n=1 Tax=Marinomonas rhizomae TaxID=491948 RepID=A0A366J856_9GAMM|nr:DMT family transporter [Marinomonas rhizomae]RBP83122.1 EamA domain-containing membrane protein RarD [Marinomonas rhizomae]RNF72577.1 DMT family transporter [Marinomonas rhizomae]